MTQLATISHIKMAKQKHLIHLTSAQRLMHVKVKQYLVIKLYMRLTEEKSA